MENRIELDNNYFLEVSNNIENCIDIKEIRYKEIKKKNLLILKIDFNTLDKKDYKKILRKLLHVKSIVQRKHIEFGILQEDKRKIGYLVNYDKNNKQQNDFILAINAIFYNTRYERYNYIYDTVCDYLDSYFYGKNLCDFNGNKCGEKRNTLSTAGCCHHFKVKWLGFLSKLVLCEHLKEDYTCGAKCISCKLFTCDYLRKKGIEFKIKDILLLDVFFNSLQKYFIKYMVFEPKEKIMKRLIRL